MASAQSKTTELRKAFQLSEVKELNRWYSLQFPELLELKPRVGHSLISIEPGKVLVIGGGNHEGALQDFLEIDLDPDEAGGGSRVKDHPGKSLFPAKYEFLCAKDKSDRVWIFGGADTGSTSNEVIVLQGQDGNQVLEKVKCLGLVEESNANNNPEPSPRTQGSNSAIVESEGKEYLAVYAGGMKGEQPVDDRNLHLFDITSHEWQTVKVNIDDKLVAQFPFGCQPPIVQGHVMTANGSKILLHGGINNVTLYDGFHCMNLEKISDGSLQKWTDCCMDYCGDKPEGRAAHGIAKASDVDKKSKVIYMFGGLGKNGACNDLWSFDFESMGWTRILKNHGEESYGWYPMPRLDFGMCTVGRKEKSSGELSVYLIIHGGMSPQGDLYNDAWVMKVS